MTATDTKVNDNFSQNKAIKFLKKASGAVTLVDVAAVSSSVAGENDNSVQNRQATSST